MCIDQLFESLSVNLCVYTTVWLPDCCPQQAILFKPVKHNPAMNTLADDHHMLFVQNRSFAKCKETVPWG